MNREELTHRLMAHGVQATPQRLQVAEVVFEKPQHLSAEQIIMALRGRGTQVSKATVYNTLNLFCERGLLHTVQVDPMRRFYDSTTSPHHHFYNVDTGELTDIPADAVEFTVTADLPPGTHRDGIDVVVRIRGDGPAAGPQPD